MESREEAFMFIRSWVEDVRELLWSWIEEGEGRPKFPGSKLEFELGHLENCWEAVREEIQEEEDSEAKEKQISEMVTLKMQITLLKGRIYCTTAVEEICEPPHTTLLPAFSPELGRLIKTDTATEDDIKPLNGTEGTVKSDESRFDEEGSLYASIHKERVEVRTQQALAQGINFKEDVWAKKLEVQERRPARDVSLIPEPLGPPPWPNTSCAYMETSSKGGWNRIGSISGLPLKLFSSIPVYERCKFQPPPLLESPPPRLPVIQSPIS